jgi:hypothetical protein
MDLDPERTFSFKVKKNFKTIKTTEKQKVVESL